MIPVSDANAKSNPCLAHDCHLCCYETEMPLLESDIARLVALGHERDSFVEMDPIGYPVLRNKPAAPPNEGHHCVLLGDDGKCSVYAHRPEGCRWYPITFTPERRIVKDEDCPHRAEFPVPQGAQRRIQKLLNEIDREGQRRLRAK